MKFLQEWTGRHFDNEGIENYEYFNATVPGNIQCDYLKFIGETDPMYADNLEKMEQTEDWYWEYRTELSFEKEDDDSVWLVSEGIDYTYDVLLDGEKIYTHTGMFTSMELDIDGKAKNGSILQIIIHPHPKDGTKTIQPRTLANKCFRPVVHYGWDLNPKLMVSGLWKPIYIETRKKDFIKSCEPFYNLNKTRDAAQVHFETCCEYPVTYTVYDREKNIVYKGTQSDFTLENINLWWCNGQGEQYLYTWTAETDSDKKSGTIGFRTMRLVCNAYADQEPKTFPKSRYATFITIELNGRRIFAKGSNLVNTDIFPGNVTADRYEELLSLARDANFNILRLWGGAAIRKNEFYDMCDRMGIMVWQEFMLACNRYEGTDEYLGVLEQEATAIIKLLRRHPSLVLWCGGNELFNGWSRMDEQDYALRMLNKLCFEHDRKTPFLMTSPSTGMAHGGYTFVESAITGKREVYEVFQTAHATAYTEFGVPSICDYETLKKIIPPEELENLTDTKNWRYHNAVKQWGEQAWAFRPSIELYFGNDLTTEQLSEYSRLMQQEGLKAAFEEIRRQQPYCSMALSWCFNEPWITAANNSMVAYPARPKPAYYAVKNSLSPVVASAKISKFRWTGEETFAAELWLLNDSNEMVSDEIKAVIILGDEEYDVLDWKTNDVKERTNKLGPTIHFTLPDSLEIETFKLKLIAKNGNSNEYVMKYKPKKQRVYTGQLNV